MLVYHGETLLLRIVSNPLSYGMGINWKDLVPTAGNAEAEPYANKTPYGQ